MPYLIQENFGYVKSFHRWICVKESIEMTFFCWIFSIHHKFYSTTIARWINKLPLSKRSHSYNQRTIGCIKEFTWSNCYWWINIENPCTNWVWNDSTGKRIHRGYRTNHMGSFAFMVHTHRQWHLFQQLAPKSSDIYQLRSCCFNIFAVSPLPYQLFSCGIFRTFLLFIRVFRLGMPQCKPI